MGTRIEFKNDRTRATEEMEGSDGRANTSARVDGRAYYNARDRGQTYSAVFNDPDVAVNDFFFYLRNISVDKQFVVDAIGINATDACSIKLHHVTNQSPSGGSVIVAENTNLTSNNDAALSCVGDSALSATTDHEIDILIVGDDGHEEFRLKERLRLGQNDAIALEFDRVTSAETSMVVQGVLYGYFEFGGGSTS